MNANSVHHAESVRMEDIQVIMPAYIKYLKMDYCIWLNR